MSRSGSKVREFEYIGVVRGLNSEFDVVSRGVVGVVYLWLLYGGSMVVFIAIF